MALPVIADCYRVTVEFQTVDGMTPRCVHHLESPSGDVAEVGASWWAAAPEGLYGPMLGDHEPIAISIIPLDGTSATYTVVRPGGAETLCLGSGQAMPSVAAVVSLRTLQRGPRGRGRQYVGPLVEQAQSDGRMESTTRLNLYEAWTTFIGALPEQDPECHLAVASYVHAQSNAVINHDVDLLVGTQRRRQDQLR